MARLLPLLALGLSLAAARSTGLADSANAPVPAPSLDNGYLKLGFDRLSGFKFVAPNYDPITDANKPPPTGEDQIPERVKEFSGKKAVITGFMLPTKLDNGKATEFLIMANQMACCFGTVPNMNDWVVVHMPQGVEVVQDVPISFYGKLKVGAMYENGYMTGIYEMQADKMGEIK
jgi:hypothetical protein